MRPRPVRLYWSGAAVALILVLGGLRAEPGPSAADSSPLAAEPSPSAADPILPDVGPSTSDPVASASGQLAAGAEAAVRPTDPPLAATSDPAGSPSDPVASSPDGRPTPSGRTVTAIEPEAVQPRTTSLDPTTPSVTTDDDRPRRYRRRYRNRYPGPIPTPDEWEPPEGPVRIALQAGHWRAAEAPSELSGLRDNGTRWNDVAEWQANLEIARRAGAMLDSLGYVVDILPAVVPPGYRAHLFISIHADGSGDPRASGYRVAAPRRDATGRAETMARLLQEQYGAATGLRHLTSSTRRMRNYYAFNFRRYEHALHPMTIAVILETGFLTSARDRTVIVDDPDRAAAGIVEAVRSFPVTALPAVVDDR